MPVCMQHNFILSFNANKSNVQAVNIYQVLGYDLRILRRLNKLTSFNLTS